MSKGAAWTLDEYERDVLGEAQRVSPLRPAAKADGSASLIVAKPFAWPDPATIPRREFLFGRHYIRKAIGATIAGGARAKTTLSHIEAVSMACGRILLTGERITPLRVWCVNGEEDQDEIDRRIAAVCKRYGITEADCGDRLFVQSVRENPLRFAAMVHGAPTLNHAALKQFEAEIRARGIDVFMLDPLISFHSVVENDNGCMDLLLKEGLGAVASRTNSAGEVFHHPGKPQGHRGRLFTRAPISRRRMVAIEFGM
jgi:RecA-family ATPase